MMGRNKNYKVEDVLQSATQLFWEKGYGNASVQDLEKATGVNKSGLYAEFKSKDQLYLRCLAHYSEQNNARKALLRMPQGWENIREFLLTGGRCQGAKGCFVANSVREFSSLPKKTRSAIAENLEEMGKLMGENLKAAGVAESSVAPLASLILTFSSGLALRLNLGSLPNYDSLVEDFLGRLKA